ncbi:MAG: DUF3857 domain-containing protein [Ferruginibacter sp.]
MKKKLKWLFIFLGLHTATMAQTPEEIKQAFPVAEIVFQNYDEELNLFLKDGLPVAEVKNNIDMLILGDKNVSRYSRYSVYQTSYDSITQLDAWTKVPVGNKFKTIKVTDKKTSNNPGENTFYDDIQETEFDFPGLVQNAVAHVDYTQFNKDAHLLSGFYVPTHMPVINATYRVIVPNEISIKYIIKNDPGKLFQFSEEKKKKETIYTWTIKNVKPQDYYANAPNPRYFQPHVIVYITAYQDKDGNHSFLNSVEDLYKWSYGFIKDLNTTPDPSLKSIVDSLISGLNDEKSKARKIYQWVQGHIKYVAFENGLEGFRPRQARDICLKRYGDCKDMSSIITTMLRMAGIKAYYTWIGTRSLPYAYTEIPLPIVDNHMISTAFIDGNWIFFDGTDPNAKYDLPPEGIQGKEAMVGINEKEFKILTVPVANAEKTSIVDSTFISIDDTGVKGYESVNYNGYFGKEVYNSLLYRDATTTKEYVNKRMSKGSNKFILGNYTITKNDPQDNVANIRADFDIPGYSKKVGNEYYVNLNIEKILENQVIDPEKRKVPLENDYNYSIKQYHILDIPDGYGVSYLPQNYSFENDLIQINMYYKVENRKVIAAQEVKTKKLMINPSDFEEWNKPMKALQPYYKETVVLEKK